MGVGVGPSAGGACTIVMGVVFCDFLRGFPFVGFVFFLSTDFAFLAFGEEVVLLKNGEVVVGVEGEGGGMS